MREEINRGKPCLFVCFRFTADNDRMFKFIQHGTSHVPIWLVCRHLQSHYLGVLVWLLKVQFQSSKHVWSVPVLAPTLWNALSADVPESQAPGWSQCLCDREGESWSTVWLWCYCGTHLHSHNHQDTRTHLKNLKISFFFSPHTEDKLGDIPHLFWTHTCKYNTVLHTTRCAKASPKDDSV